MLIFIFINIDRDLIVESDKTDLLSKINYSFGLINKKG